MKMEYEKKERQLVGEPFAIFKGDKSTRYQLSTVGILCFGGAMVCLVALVAVCKKCHIQKHIEEFQDENKMMVVTYKSYPQYFEKEQSGIKNNTVRLAYNTDIRTRQLKLIERKKELEGKYEGTIKIINKDNDEQYFERQIRDVTFFSNLVVITWEP